MKTCYTECVISLNDESPLYGKWCVRIRVDDQGGGPYLLIRGENLEPDVNETRNDFFLQSEEEIDQFADTCKNMLRQANKAAA